LPEESKRSYKSIASELVPKQNINTTSKTTDDQLAITQTDIDIVNQQKDDGVDEEDDDLDINQLGLTIQDKLLILTRENFEAQEQLKKATKKIQELQNPKQQKEFQEWKAEQQKVNEVYQQIDRSVQYQADKIELSPNKLKLINNKRLKEHPELQKSLVERVSGMSLKDTELEVFQAIRDLETGGDPKNREIVKGGDKVVEPIQVAHIDVTKAIRQFIFRLTNQELTIDDFEHYDKIINNTQKYRISLAKVANPRTLMSYEKDLVLAADIALDMLKLIEKEFDSRNMKRDMIKQ